MKTIKISQKDFVILQNLVKQHKEFFDGKMWNMDDVTELIGLGDKLATILSFYLEKKKKPNG